MMPRPAEIFCPLHPLTRMICPRCEGGKGGRKTARVHANKLARWGRKGGRGKKKDKA